MENTVEGRSLVSGSYLGALGPRLGHDVGVDGLDGPLEAGELHHGVGDLPAPERHQRLVEPVHPLSRVDLGRGLAQRRRERARRRRLDADLRERQQFISHQ